MNKLKAKTIRLIENKIRHPSRTNLERQSEMLLGEMILSNEYTKTFGFAKMELDCALTDFKIELLKSLLPENTHPE